MFTRFYRHVYLGEHYIAQPMVGSTVYWLYKKSGFSVYKKIFTSLVSVIEMELSLVGKEKHSCLQHFKPELFTLYYQCNLKSI